MIDEATEVGSKFRLECAVGIDRSGGTLLIKQEVLATVHVEAELGNPYEYLCGVCE
jgi:hypothetical protein